VDTALDQLRRRLHRFSAQQPGCQALQTHYCIRPLTGVAIWEELGDTRRFPNSTAAVRHSDLDITVYSSDTTGRAPLGETHQQRGEPVRQQRHGHAARWRRLAHEVDLAVAHRAAQR
jgi:hypothetical protein